jgi:hypothetical protein
MRGVGPALLTAAVVIAALPAGAAAQDSAGKLPVVVIDTPAGIGDEPGQPGTMRVFDRERREEYSGPVGIELHGHSSLKEDPKKSYEFETRNKSGRDENVSLLGLPEDDDWVLIASYKDESLLRNLVAYSAARWLGRYASRARLVEVIVNDSYEGVYLLAEELKLHDKRVAVDDSDLSGGYLLEVVSTSRTQGERFFTTPVRDEPIVYKDPEGDDISHGRATWIRDYVSRFERVLYSDRFRDRLRGYRRYLDMGAAVDYALLNELFRNADTFRNSTYIHKGVGEKLVLGPIWDFDHALGDDRDPDFNALDGWQYQTRSNYEWIDQLYADPAFRNRLAKRWRTVRRRGLLRHIKATIDDGAGQLAGGPQERNFSRWPIFGTRAAGPEDPRTGAPPANYAQAVDYLKWWVVKRARWIDRNVDSLRPS